MVVSTVWRALAGLMEGPTSKGTEDLWRGRIQSRWQELGYQLPGLTLGARFQDQKEARIGARGQPDGLVPHTVLVLEQGPQQTGPRPTL